jgi:hypothetical protein
MGMRADTERQKRRNTSHDVFWSGCRAVTEFIVRVTTYICLKKVRAKDTITSHFHEMKKSRELKLD